MLKNLITRLYKWSIKNEVKNAKVKKLTKETRTKQQMVTRLQSVYQFVQWLNTRGFPNRRIKKTFWRNVSNNQPVLETTLQNLIQRYSSNKRPEPTAPMARKGRLVKHESKTNQENKKCS